MKKIFLFILIIFLISACTNNSENAELEAQVKELNAERDSLVRQNSQLKNKMDSVNNETNFWYSNHTEGKQLLDAGIANPKEYIINSLKQRPVLIPAEPVLGGQMRFTRVLLLGRNCLIAYYEDGHIAGKMIYSFEFSDGKLNFTPEGKCL